MSREFIARLEALPKKNGMPDFSSFGDPAQVAHKWAAQLGLDRENMLAKLLAHLESPVSSEGVT